MKTQPIIAGSLLIIAPLLFNGAFAVLGSRFDYPAILNHPAGEVLTRFAAGGEFLLGTWYVMLMAAFLLIPLALSTAKPLAGQHATPAIVFGVVAGLVQSLGLARWVFVTPYLAEVYSGSNATIATKETVEVVFNALNLYLGVGVGEHLGYLFTGLWTLTIARGLWEANHRAFSAVGLIAGIGILLGLGEATGANWAKIATVIGYILWAGWLIGLGVRTLWKEARPLSKTQGFQLTSVTALILLSLITSGTAKAQAADNPAPSDRLYIHAFRSPLIGVEYRKRDWGLYAGRYTTIISKNDEGGNEDTWFNKVGVTYYFGAPFTKLKRDRLESFVSVAYMRGTENSWKNKNALFFENGVRYSLGRGFEARLGTGILFSEGHGPRVNPTPGISYSIPLR